MAGVANAMTSLFTERYFRVFALKIIFPRGRAEKSLRRKPIDQLLLP